MTLMEVLERLHDKSSARSYEREGIIAQAHSDIMALGLTDEEVIKALDKDIYHSDDRKAAYNNNPERLCLGEILSGENIKRIAHAITEAAKKKMEGEG